MSLWEVSSCLLRVEAQHEMGIRKVFLTGYLYHVTNMDSSGDAMLKYPS